MFVLVHQLLLCKHLLIAVKLYLLYDNEVMPVDVVFRHLLVAIILLPLRLSDAFLLIEPELALLASIDDFFLVLRKGLVSLQVLTFRNEDT